MGSAATPRLEVGDKPDGQAPPASDHSMKKRGARCWVGGREEVGQRGPLCARERRLVAWEFSRAE
jgi:hypothetical protein